MVRPKKDSVNNAEGSTSKEVKKPKRTILDKLGPKWSDDELSRFYRAYRLQGADWKKVASEFPNRSVEMLRTLYSISKNYLSMPEDRTNVLGFLCAVGDHYSDLESRYSGPGVYKKQKHKRPRILLNPTKDVKKSW